MRIKFLFIAFLSVTAGTDIYSQVPQKISYQGLLTTGTGTPVADGSYDLKFEIFNLPSGGTLRHTETQTGILVQRGTFSIILGSVTPLTVSFNESLYVQVTVVAGPAGPSYPLTFSPRSEFTSAPYSLQSVSLLGPNSIATGVGANAGGSNNRARGDYSVVNGGGGPAAFDSNSAAGMWSTVGGGHINSAKEYSTTVGGGENNTASRAYGTVSGGFVNSASGNTATIGGGSFNQASGSAASIGGGFGNQSSGISATVGGGASNRARGDYSVVSGGGGVGSNDSNSAVGTQSAVGGGARNVAGGQWSTVSGGTNNMAGSDWSTISGGGYNIASGVAAAITGGNYNRARGNYSFVGGGGGAIAVDSNSAVGDYSTVGGGLINSAGAYSATVGGGEGNKAIGYIATVGGGATNIASNDMATIGGGWLNTSNGIRSTVAGGERNGASGQTATVGGGFQNTASGYSATVGGGYGNNAGWNYATVGGGGANTANNNFSTISGGNGNVASGYSATVAGGAIDSASGFYSTVPGGIFNTAAGDYSFAAGRRAKANHAGSFVWADQTNSDFASTGADQFLIRASGGVGIGTNNPSAKLTVNANITNVLPAVPGIMIGNPSGSTAIWLGKDQSNYLELGWLDPDFARLNAGGGHPLVLQTDGGNVGIGTIAPSQKLHVAGNICATGTIGSCSDRRYKKEIEPLSFALENVVSLQGVHYRWRTEEFPEKNFSQDSQIGLIAQDVEKFYPEVVLTDQNGYKSVDYGRLTPVLIEAVKELNSKNQELLAELAELKAFVKSLAEQSHDREKKSIGEAK